MERVRVGVIGLGVGEQHLLAYQALPQCEVVVACDLDGEKLRALGARCPGIALTAAPGEVLASPAVDLVSIASYDDCHAEQVIAALEAGKHVFAEKPLCQNLNELARIEAAWSRQGRRCLLAVNLVLRAAPLYQWLRQQVAAGALGSLYALEGDYLYGRLHKLTGGWRGRLAHYSVMAGGGIHLLDLLLWLTGERPVWVTAAGNRLCTAGSGFGQEDYVVYTLECPSGLVARIGANFGCVHRHQHVLRLFGTQATFIHDDSGARLHQSRDPGQGAVPVDLAPLAAKGALLPDFVAAVQRGDDLSAQTQVFFDAVSICAAGEVALRTRTRQEIRYL